jgi:hypothetical protein
MGGITIDTTARTNATNAPINGELKMTALAIEPAAVTQTIQIVSAAYFIEF